MLLCYIKTVDVVEEAVVCFGNNWISIPEVFLIPMLVDKPFENGIAHNANAIGIGDHDRCFEKSRFGNPRCARHFAIAIETVPISINGIIRFTAGKSCSYAGSYRSFANHVFALAGDDGGVTHFHTSHVGDCVILSWYSFEGDAEFACAGFLSERDKRYTNEKRDDSFHKINLPYNNRHGSTIQVTVCKCGGLSILPKCSNSCLSRYADTQLATPFVPDHVNIVAIHCHAMNCGIMCAIGYCCFGSVFPECGFLCIIPQHIDVVRK